MNLLRMNRMLGVAICFASVSLFVSVLVGQTPTGAISGVVKDESGAVIPGATIGVSNVATGVRRSVTTDSAGRYRVPGLDPGPYSVEAQATGFQTEERRGLQLTVGREMEIELVLRVGQVTEKTVVTAEAPLVETVSNTLSGLVDDKTIRELPLNGRSFDHLINLQPGVHWFRTGGHVATGGLMSEYFTVGGSRALSNQFLVDGTELLGIGGQSILPGGILGTNMGVDAIQEFTVLLGNYSAAYGKRAGGIVSIVTRPGTNQLHGSVFEFLRNDNLDARNFFDPGSHPGEFKRNQFGGSIGGPVRHDRTFFFGTYEGLREGLGLTNVAIVPDNNARQGLLPDPRNPGQLRNVGVAPNVRPFIPSLFGPPNGRNFGDGTAEYIASPTRVSRQDFFLVRLDHNFSEKDSLFGRYSYTSSTRDAPALNSLFSAFSTSGNQTVTLVERRVYPTTLNEARIGFGRARAFSTTAPISPLDPSLIFVEGAKRIGVLIFTTGGGVSGGALTATGTTSAQNRALVINQLEFADQLSHYVGRHSFQFGASVQRIQHNENWLGNHYGQFEFPGLENFLLGQPLRFTGPPPGGGDSTKAYRRIYFAGFAQDDFKLRPNLTLNLGLRYELMTVPVEASGNRISNYHLRLQNGYRVLDSTPTVGSPFFRGNHNLWTPRLGFAWNPAGDGKTVIRGGFGIFYDQVVSEFRFYTPNNPPFFGTLEVNNPPFPLGYSGGAAGQTPRPTPEGVDVGLRIPTKLQWNWSVQRQLATSTVVSVAYLGSHSYHLTRVGDFNIPIPQIVSGEKFFPAGAPRRNPALGGSQIVMTDSSSFYQGLQMDLTQRLSHGLRAKASYTYSKNIDEASSVTRQEALGAPAVAQDPENLRADRGLSAFDVRQSLVTNFTYDLPGNRVRGVLGKWIGGWQVSGIVAVNSGEPFTVTTGFNRSRSQSQALADRPSLRAGASNNPVLGGPDKYFDPAAFELPLPGFFGNAGRNTVLGPGLVNVDFSLVKATAVTERFRTEFRAEFFNLFNRANFGLPSNVVFNANGTLRGAAGRISATTTTSRQIQFGLKLSF